MRKLYFTVIADLQVRKPFFWCVVMVMVISAFNPVISQNAANYVPATGNTASLALDMNAVAIDMSVGTTQLVAGNLDDAASPVTNIGFTFIFMGTPYTQFTVNSNGYLRFGATAIVNNTRDFTTGMDIIAPFGEDIETDATGKVHYKLVGTAPNRCLVIEWLNMRVDYGGTTPDATFQLRLYESTGVIEFVYGAMAVSNIFNILDVDGARIGFAKGVGANNMFTITTPSNYQQPAAIAAANVNNYPVGTIADLNSSADGSRVFYQLTPPAVPAAPSALNFTAVGLTKMTLNWTDNSTTESGFAVMISTDGINYTLLGTAAADATSYIALGLTPGTTYYFQVLAATEGTISTPVSGSQATASAVPMAGVYTINNLSATGGTNFNNFSDAFDAINGNGISAAVTFNVSAGQTFTEILPPLTTSGLSATDTIAFVKFGAGANPVVTRADAGTLATSAFGGQGDAVLIIQGADYITFNGIDVSATDQGIEYGYLLRKASATNGSKNVRIKNAAITMNRGTSIYVTGIYSSNLDAASAVGSATGVTVTSQAGRHENINITGNTISNVFYGVQLRGYAHSAAPYDLYDTAFVIGAAGAGNGNTINNFGGTGTATCYGIYVLQHKGADVSYNAINNMDNGGVAATGAMYGIYMSTGTTSNFTATYNQVTITGAATGSSLYGVSNGAATGSISLGYNTVSLNNTASSSSSYFFVQNAAVANPINIFNNSFAASTFANTSGGFLIHNSVSYTGTVNIQNNATTGTIQKTGNSTLYGYYDLSSPTGVVNISGNNFSNMSTDGTSGLSGITINTAAGNTQNVFNNTISNLTGGSGNVTGIVLSLGNNRSVYGNQVYTLIGTGNVFGISMTSGSGTSGNIYKNKIYDIASNSASAAATSPVAIGMNVSGGTIYKIYNNIIGDIKAPSVSVPHAVSGLYISTTAANGSISVYNNTIYLEAAAGASNFGSSGVYATANATATTAALDLRNNIIVNLSTASGTGYTAAFRRSAVALNNYVTASNNNLFYVGASAGTNFIYYDGTNMDATLTDFKVRVSARESASVSEPVNFISTTGIDPTFLHINTSIATQIESGGVTISDIADDFDGNTRNNPPDIGADEFAGIPADLTGPSISYTSVANTICFDPPSISAIITDASGVNTVAGTKPRLWFKKSTENDAWVATNTSAGNGWKWVEATNSTSPFIFTFDYNLLTSPVVRGDSISYFIAAQDNASTPNVGTNLVVFTNPPVSVALSASAFPTSGNIKGFRLLDNAITIKANGAVICESAAITLSMDNSDVNGATVQWQKSPAGTNVWTDIPLATTIPFTTPVITESTDFRLIVSCNGTPIPLMSPSNVVSVTVNNPQITGTTAASRCGIGTLNLSASAGGLDINWYDVSSGGEPIATGTAFTTPVLSTTKTYYAAAMTPSPGTFSVGAGASTSNTYPNPFYSLWSNTHVQYLVPAAELSAAGLTAGNIDGLGINITDAGTLPVINLSIKMAHTSMAAMTAFSTDPFTTVFNSASYMPAVGLNTLAFSASFNWDGVSNVVIEICHGNASSSATMNRVAQTDITPYISTIKTHKSAASAASATCGDFTTNLLTYSERPKFTFVAGGCVGARVAVTATINTPPALTAVSATPASLCEGQSTNLQVTSSNTGYTYTWTPGGVGASVSASPTSTTKFYVDAVDNSGGAFNGCINRDSVTVTVNPVPSPVSVIPSSVTICPGSPAQLLTSDGGSLTGVALLNENFNGAAAGWTSTNLSTGGANPALTAWTLQPDGYAHPGPTSPGEVFHSNDNSQFYLSNADVGGSGITTHTVLSSPSFSTVGFTAATLNFYHYYKRLGTGDTTQVSVSTDGGATWIVVKQYSAAVGTASNFALENSINLDAFVGYPDVRISFRFRCGWAWYWAIDNVLVSGTAQTNITWASTTGLFTDASATTPYISGNAPTVYALPSATTTYTVTATSSANCSVTGNVTVTYSNVPTNSSVLAGTSGAAQVCANYDVSTNHYFNNCNLIASVVPGGASPVSGNVNACVKIESGLPTDANGTPYVARHFDILPATSATTATSTITLYFTQAEFNAYNAGNGGLPDLPTGAADAAGIANLRVSHFNSTTSGGLAGYAAGSGAMIDPADVDIVFDAPGNRWKVTFAVTGSGGFYVHTGIFVLPVTGLELKGQQSGEINRLTWSTVTETNNQGFELQRSANGTHFSTIGSVATKAVNGNSTSPLNYGYNDERSLSGNSYYRLKQVDKDGKITYSNTVLLSRKVKEITLSSVYPNPTERELKLVITSPKAEKVTIIVTDLSGKVLMQMSTQLVNGDNQYQLNVQSIAAGTYIIKAVCANGCETAVHRFVKQ